MKYGIIVWFVLLCPGVQAQSRDTLNNGIIVYRDYRLPMVKEKEVEMNINSLKSRARGMKGYRLMVLNTRDKDYAFKVRTQLLQKFPDQKPYMWYASPYIRMKFGDFATKEEAETYRKEISAMLGGTTIYLLNETIDLNPGDDFDPESMRTDVLK